MEIDWYTMLEIGWYTLGNWLVHYRGNSASQEQSDNTRDFEGAGLGLTIVKRLVNAFGGDIQVSSKKDVGTIFTVTLPIKGA